MLTPRCLPLCAVTTPQAINLQLLLAEFYFTAPGSTGARVFSVACNGEVLAPALDIYSMVSRPLFCAACGARPSPPHCLQRAAQPIVLPAERCPAHCAAASMLLLLLLLLVDRGVGHSSTGFHTACVACNSTMMRQRCI